MKVNELQEAALNWAVAKCEGIHLIVDWSHYSPSTDWAQGGPIIERERIATSFYCWNHDDRQSAIWDAEHYEYGKRSKKQGPTPLIAAMRCYVAVKLGEEIELPEALTC